MTIDEFLLARITEREEHAKLIPDYYTEHEGDCRGTLCPGCGHCCHSSEECDHDCDGRGGGCRDAISELPDVNKWVLADCDIQRSIIDAYREMHGLMVASRPSADRTALILVGGAAALSIVVDAFATQYKDHPDFQEEWLV